MSYNKKKDLLSELSDIDLDKIVSEALHSDPIFEDVKDEITVKHEGKRENLNEANFVTQKTFKMLSDKVSEKTKIAHEKLYLNYVEAFNNTSAQTDSVPKNGANSYSSAYRSTKLDEVRNFNAIWLHELFFNGFFDPNSQIHMDSKVFMRLNRDFGGFDNWQKDFIATALVVGEGWVVLGYNMYLNKYVNIPILQHSNNLMIGVLPILALDMWTHSYILDFEIDKKSYIVTMMRQIDWNVAEKIVDQAEKVSQVLK